MMADPTLLQMKYARIVNEFAMIADISWETALDYFYHSATYELIREGIYDLHCHSDGYLAELLLEEYKLDDKERDKRLKALNEMTEAEFNARMAKGYTEAIHGECVSAEEAFEELLRELRSENS